MWRTLVCWESALAAGGVVGLAELLAADLYTALERQTMWQQQDKARTGVLLWPGRAA